MTEPTMPPVAELQIETAPPAFAAASLPTLGTTITRPLSTPGNGDQSQLPSSFYRRIAWQFWLAAVIVGGLAWLALFQLLGAAPGHP